MAESSPDNKLTIRIFIAMVLAIPLGLLAHRFEAVAGLIPYVSWLGTLFRQMLLLIIYPLVLASMVTGVVSLGDIRHVGGLVGRCAAFFAATTGVAVVIGLSLVNLLQPGQGVDLGVTVGAAAPELVHQSFGEFFLAMLKNTLKNPFSSMASGDVLGIITFGLLLGAVLSTMGDEAKPLRALFESLNAAMMRLTDWVMQIAPLGVFALLLQVVASQGVDALVAVGRYVIVVVVGLLVHGLLVLPTLGWTLGGVSPLRLLRGARAPLAISFSTASSSATLPVTIEMTERELGVSPKVAGFVLPLGATVNMNGTALYEAVAAMFIAQAYGIQLDLGQQLLIFITATLAAVGAAGIPSAGLITMSLVLNAVGLPLEGIALILAVDRVLDMLRTSVNVFGDITCAVVLQRFEAPEPNAAAASS
ncbi:MAG: dicarboxylate/amino acid:cation symporter [Deltaproteobacteria bacterium]|nr:dicarboxylate/amino acid:cation symporter [Deltaproteobacteria bacterium]